MDILCATLASAALLWVRAVSLGAAEHADTVPFKESLDRWCIDDSSVYAAITGMIMIGFLLGVFPGRKVSSTKSQQMIGQGLLIGNKPAEV